MILLRVTYRLRAHHMAEFERIFEQDILPLVQAEGLRFQGIWRTLVGDVGEYMELWEFASLEEFGNEWPQLLAHPRLQEIFQLTGPMVEGEKFTLLEPVGGRSSLPPTKPLQP